MIRIVELEQTCDSYPSQWEGRSDDGRYVYIRYRFGELLFGVHDQEELAILLADTVGICDGMFDGELSTSEMMERLTRSGVATFERKAD